jgi:hypothetical protein
LGLIAQPRNLARLNGIAQSDFAEMKEVSDFFTLCAMRLALCSSVRLVINICIGWCLIFQLFKRI